VQDELEAAKALAIRAGAILLKHYPAPKVDWKGQNNPVTEADREANVFLVEEIMKLFPADGILSEEAPDKRDRLSRSRVWIIDPLDGTTEFIKHHDEFTVMIGLSVDGISTMGVVYQPARERLYYAESGTGAFLTEGETTRRLQVSSESNSAAMTIVLSRSHHTADVDLIKGGLGVTNTIVSGSLGLKVGLICEGRADLFLQSTSHTCQWDTCAADVILREAGGRMTDLLNAPLCYNSLEVRNMNGVIATNGILHDSITSMTHSILARKL
jgi:3'(2'), 5'-bisphosphate nucleotidase